MIVQGSKFRVQDPVLEWRVEEAGQKGESGVGVEEKRRQTADYADWI